MKLFEASLLEWLRNFVDRGVFTTDTELKVCTWNAWLERYSGRSAAEAVGRNLLEIYPELKERRLDQHFSEALSGQSRTLSHTLHGYLLPLRPLAADLGFELMRQSAQIMPLIVEGRIVGTITMLEDVTERAATERELRLQVAELQRLSAREQAARAKAEDASRLKDEFLATVSHELRTPLTSILGWARILRVGSLGETEAIRVIETIERNAQVQNQLIEDLLDVSRIITGKLRLDLRPIELHRVIDAAIDTVRPVAEAKGINLDCLLDAAVGPVLGDADRLQQVVWNLLANAIKFTPQGGNVRVRLQRDENQARMIVADTGLGITDKFLPYVFDRFSQADNSLSRQQGGLGLGLAIVRHLVELHGGTVSVDSPGPGKGSTFQICFPIVGLSLTEPLIPGISSYSLMDATSDLSVRPDLLVGITVLVVDDDQDGLRLCEVLLERAGAEVRTADSAAAALEMLDSWWPDVLVSDIGMPEQDGYELIRKVRAREKDRDHRIPAVALTAYSKSDDRLRAFTAGFQMHVPKPIEPEELITVVAGVSGRLGGGETNDPR